MSNNWPKYESHKVVQAARIVGVEHNHAGGTIVQGIWVRAREGDLAEEFWPTVAGMAETAKVGGFAMVYPDGFKSISPEGQFKLGYTIVPE